MISYEGKCYYKSRSSKQFLPKRRDTRTSWASILILFIEVLFSFTLGSFSTNLLIILFKGGKILTSLRELTLCSS